jgi:hypothetical protein
MMERRHMSHAARKGTETITPRRGRKRDNYRKRWMNDSEKAMKRDATRLGHGHQEQGTI